MIDGLCILKFEALAEKVNLLNYLNVIEGELLEGGGIILSTYEASDRFIEQKNQ